MVPAPKKLTPVMIASKSLIGSERTVLSEKAVWNFATARFSQSDEEGRSARHQHVGSQARWFVGELAVIANDRAQPMATSTSKMISNCALPIPKLDKTLSMSDYNSPSGPVF